MNLWTPGTAAQVEEGIRETEQQHNSVNQNIDFEAHFVQHTYLKELPPIFTISFQVFIQNVIQISRDLQINKEINNTKLLALKQKVLKWACFWLAGRQHFPKGTQIKQTWSIWKIFKF